jgi:hypothetical protein
MRHSLKFALAVVVAAGFATGCGSDDDSDKPRAGGASDEAKTTESSDKDSTGTKAKSTSKPKRESARGQMVSCMEKAGFEVTHEGEDAAAATNYTVGGDEAKSRKAVIIIHSNKNDASAAATKAGEEKALNAVAFGRAEFIRYHATDTEAGQLANCVAEGYTR